MLAEALAALDPRGPGVAIDATFGAGGYTRALLERDPGVSVVAIDRDPQALAAGAAH